MVITPDHDVYPEQVDAANPDLTEFYSAGPGGQPPPGAPPNILYRFAAMPLATLRQLLQQAEVCAQGERVAVGFPMIPAQAGQLVPVGPAAPAAPGVPGGAPVQTCWVCIEDQVPYARGDVVVPAGQPLPAGAVIAPFPPGCQATYAYTGVPSGHVVMLKALTDLEAKAMVRGDLRTLPICFDSQGNRHRNFSEAVCLMVEDKLPGGDLNGIEGPKTVLPIALSAKAKGRSFRTDCDAWIVEANIPAGDRSRYEAEVITEALTCLVEIDQLNAPNLASAEILARRWQLIKEAHRLCPSNPDYSSSDFFMGWKHRKVGVAQDLSKFVADQVKDETARMKELRKGREEADAARGRNLRGKGGKGRGARREPATDG